MLGDLFTLHEIHCWRVVSTRDVDFTATYVEEGESWDEPYGHTWRDLPEIEEEAYLEAVGTVAALV